MKLLKEKKIAFIGSGNMGGALIKGLTGASGISAKNIIASDMREDRLEQLKTKYRVKVTRDNRKAVKQADVIVLAGRPTGR